MTSPTRSIPIDLIRRLEGGEPTIICEAIHRGGGGREWHVFTDLFQLIELMEAHPMNRLEVYELGKEINCLTVKGGSY